MAHIHNSQHNQKKIVRVQTNTVVFYGHPELSGKEKSKFEFEEKKFSLLLKVAFLRQKRLQTSLFSNKLNFFPRIQILIFLREATQNDHNILLYKFENDQKILVVLGVVDMRQLLLRRRQFFTIFDPYPPPVGNHMHFRKMS